jgi:hypothetical protein
MAYMAVDQIMLKKIVMSSPSEFADIILDLYEKDYIEEAGLLSKALESYNKFQSIVKYGGEKSERDIHSANYHAYMIELAEKLFASHNTVVSSKVFDVFNKKLNHSLKLINESKKEIDFQPTDGMVKAAQRGLDLRKEFGRGGTEVGVARARDIVNRKNLSAQTVKRMYSFFSRHGAQKTSGWKPGEENYPSAQFIAWLLWGGDPGFSWATKKRNQLEKQEESINTIINQKIKTINEATLEKRILFSSDINDFYSSDKELVDEYLDLYWEEYDLTEEDLKNINPEDFINDAIEWVNDFVQTDFKVDEAYYMRLINESFEEFKVVITFKNWRGFEQKESKKIYDIKKYYEALKNSYSDLDQIRAYIQNGKLYIELQHHDATDIIEVIGIEYKKPKRMSFD